VKYMSAQAAAYARDKLDMFEYPPGYRMTVQYIARSVLSLTDQCTDHWSDHHTDQCTDH